MEEALDLRIHNRRSSYDDGIPYPTYPTYYSSRVQVLVTYKSKIDESHGGGDLVIVEADTSKEHDTTVDSPSRSPETRSSDTDTDKGSPYYTSVTSTPSHGQQPRSVSVSSMMETDLSSTSTDDVSKSTRTSSKYTSTHVPNVDRMLKPTRLMCFLCDQKAKNGKTLETHIQKSHYVQTAQGRFLCCTECGYKYDSVDQLKSHFETSHSPRKSGDGGSKVKAYYPCSHCSRMYRKQSLLDAHMRLVNQKDTWKKNNVHN